MIFVQVSTCGSLGTGSNESKSIKMIFVWNKKWTKFPPVGEVVVWPLDLPAVLPGQIVVIHDIVNSLNFF